MIFFCFSACKKKKKKFYQEYYNTIRTRKLLLQLFKARKAYEENWQEETAGKVLPCEQADASIHTDPVRTSLTIRGQEQTRKQTVQERPAPQLG